MGTEGIYKCNKCGNKFTSREGCGFNFIGYRCEECDLIRDIVLDTAQNHPERIGTCHKCGGKLRSDLEPMCKKCKSRDVEQIETTMMFD